MINPRESITKRSFNKEDTDANVGAKLTFLWMQRASWYLVSTCSYLHKINTACGNITHMRGLNCHWKENSSLAPQGSAAERLCTLRGFPAAAHTLTSAAREKTRCHFWGASLVWKD